MVEAQKKVMTMIMSTMREGVYKKRQQTWLVTIVGTQKKALTMIRSIRKCDDDD
jgi:hypothetical protein